MHDVDSGCLLNGIDGSDYDAATCGCTSEPRSSGRFGTCWITVEAWLNKILLQFSHGSWARSPKLQPGLWRRSALKHVRYLIDREMAITNTLHNCFCHLFAALEQQLEFFCCSAATVWWTSQLGAGTLVLKSKGRGNYCFRLAKAASQPIFSRSA